jgi:prophage regulatory protein
MKIPMLDIVDVLHIDAGQRTIGELIRDRERSLLEILRLRALMSATDAKRRSPSVGRPQDSPGEPTAYVTEKLIKLGELCKLLDMARSTIYHLKKEGRFPEPIKVGYRAVRWRLSDIRAWQDARALAL